VKAKGSGEPVFLAFILSCGCALLLVPVIAAIPPYVALEYLCVGTTCVAAVLVKVLDRRISALSGVVGCIDKLRTARRLAARSAP